MAKYKVEARGHKMDADFRSISKECALGVYSQLRGKASDFFCIRMWDLETGEIYRSCTIEEDGSGYSICEFIAK